jgi:transcriptional regulator with XRE-family HTH domain
MPASIAAPVMTLSYASVHIAAGAEAAQRLCVAGYPGKKGRPRTDPALKKQVGARIRAGREALGLEQAELADTVGIRPHSMWRYEDGRALAGPDIMNRIAAALGVTEAFLMRGDEAPAPRDPAAPQYPAAFAKMQELLPAYLADHGHAPPSPEEWAVLATQPFSTPAGEEPGVRNFFHALMSHRIRDPERIAEGKRVSAEDERGRVASGMGTRKAKR